MKKMFVLILAVVIGIAFAGVTFAADEKAPMKAADKPAMAAEKKDAAAPADKAMEKKDEKAEKKVEKKHHKKKAKKEEKKEEAKPAEAPAPAPAK